MTLKIKTANKKGKTTQKATIISNDPQRPSAQISITGIIKQEIRINPSTRVLLKGFYGETVKKGVTITSLSGAPFVIKNITSTIDDKIEYKLKTEQTDKKYRLDIKTRTGLQDNFRGKIILETSSPKKPKIVLSVAGSLKKVIKAIPEYLYFGIIDTSKAVIDARSLQRTTALKQAQGNKVVIKGIETSKPWIVAEADTKQEGKSVIITIRLDKDKLPKGTFREQVTIHSEYNKKPEMVTVIVEGKVI